MANRRSNRGRIRAWAGVVWLALGLVIPLGQPAAGNAQTPTPDRAVPADPDAWLDEMLAGMSTADKVGQLFLVTFEGDEVGAGSQIAHLIQVLRVGGVILSAENGNWRNELSAPRQVLSLTHGLQELAFTPSSLTITGTVPVTVTPVLSGSGSLPTAEPITITTRLTVTQVVTVPAQGIPLLIAVSQEGDGYPFASLRGGFTGVPSQMGIGATWRDSHAQTVGQMVGRELAAVGINLLLGPSLDIVNNPRSGQPGDLGTRVFGGDPYWVGRMGRAYVRGVHLGSQGRVATVAKHLPGLGASDRSLEEEVATVDRSLTDLRIIELPPFFAVTHAVPMTDTTDALMTAHIRYRGFQGNIRSVTPPISFHAQGLQQIMSQPELAAWREGGGLLVSDSLGVPAVRRYYSPNLSSFPHRQIALDAFLAGNDLLNLSRFSATDSWDEQMRNVEDTILFFRTRYEADSNFRARVDQSVRRILALKRRLCPEFTLEACTPDEAGLADVGKGQGAVAQVAQDALTLLYPSAEELTARLPRPPRPDEDIVIFTEARQARDCATCSPFYLLAPQALEQTILRLYGPEATRQVDPERIRSFTFVELSSFLQSGSPDLSEAIRGAEWILFAMLDYAPASYPDSAALKQFLREWTTAQPAQNIVVLAYESPYYLDTTEVSKLTAYLGVYSKMEPFIEASIRALFLEFTPAGRSPVSIQGVGYDLTKQLSPDPGQVIEVAWVDAPEPAQGTPQPVEMAVGDPLRVRTNVILDHNGNPVPDGTPVTFHSFYLAEQLERRIEAVTVGGVAEATIILELAGGIEIRATSDPAVHSRPLLVRLTGETAVILTPTPTMTPTPTSTPTVTPTPLPTATPRPTWTPTPIAVPVPPAFPEPEPRVRWVDLLLAVVGLVMAGGVVGAVGHRLHLQTPVVTPFGRAILWSSISGLTGYLFYGLGLPGSQLVEGILPGLRGLVVGFTWGLLPLLPIYWWYRREKQERA